MHVSKDQISGSVVIKYIVNTLFEIKELIDMEYEFFTSNSY